MQQSISNSSYFKQLSGHDLKSRVASGILYAEAIGRVVKCRRKGLLAITVKVVVVI